MQTVSIDSLVLQPSGAAGWFFSSIQGWDDVPESKVEVRERPVSDGAFGIDQDWRRSLAISVEGGFSGSSRDEVLAAKQVVRALGNGAPRTVAVANEEGTTTRTVSVRVIDVPDDFGRTVFTFAIDMVALDPKRYGPEVSVSTGLPTAGTGMTYPIVYPLDFGSGGDPGRLTMTNAGQATTFPVLEVQGGLSLGVELVEITTGSYLRLDRAIPASSVVVFNARTGRVYLDDPANDISSFLTRRDWSGFAVPAGSSRTVQFTGLGTASGSPLLTARFSPAY